MAYTARQNSTTTAINRTTPAGSILNNRPVSIREEK